MLQRTCIAALMSIELLPDRLAMAMASLSLLLLYKAFWGKWIGVKVKVQYGFWADSTASLQILLEPSYKLDTTNSKVEWKKNVSTATTPV